MKPVSISVQTVQKQKSTIENHKYKYPYSKLKPLSIQNQENNFLKTDMRHLSINLPWLRHGSVKNQLRRHKIVYLLKSKNITFTLNAYSIFQTTYLWNFNRHVNLIYIVQNFTIAYDILLTCQRRIKNTISESCHEMGKNYRSCILSIRSI